MVVIIPNATIKLGENANDCVIINNCRRVLWEPVPRAYVPQMVMGTDVPVAFLKPPKYIRGEIHVLSEAYDAFFNNGTTHKAYILPNGQNKEIPYFEVIATDANGGQWKYTFTGVVPVDYAGTFTVGEEVVHVYPFVAKYVTTTKPT
jgi:hypothetical protein